MLVCKENELRRRIPLAGHTFKSFADSIGISYSYMSNILNGRACSGVIAKQIANALNVQIEDIFEAKEHVVKEG